MLLVFPSLFGLPDPLVNLVTWMTGPDTIKDEDAVPRYINDSLLQEPGLALEAVSLEMVDLAKRTRDFHKDSVETVIEGSEDAVADLEKRDDIIDKQYAAIINHLRSLAKEDLDDSATDEVMTLLKVADNIESIGDVLDKNLLPLAHNRIHQRIVISEVTSKLIRELHHTVSTMFDDIVLTLDGTDPGAARRVIDSKGNLKQLIAKADEHYARRLLEDAPDRVATYSLERDLVEYERRIASLLRNLAKAVDTGKDSMGTITRSLKKPN